MVGTHESDLVVGGSVICSVVDEAYRFEFRCFPGRCPLIKN